LLPLSINPFLSSFHDFILTTRFIRLSTSIRRILAENKSNTSHIINPELLIVLEFPTASRALRIIVRQGKSPDYLPFIEEKLLLLL
jgi:hypothetical protein